MIASVVFTHPAPQPLRLLLLLAEFCIGGQLFLFAADVRGTVTRGFVKMGAAIVSLGSALTLWVAILVVPTSSVSGYSLSQPYFIPSRLSPLWDSGSLCPTVVG